jgi:hypothetical protein
METVQLLNDVRSEILRRTLPYGGWSSGTSRQANVEVTCLALLALQYGVGIVEHDRNVLRQLQNADGSWPAFAGDSEGCWTTSLAVIALVKSEPREPIQRAAQWVLANKGRESNWLWNLKFRFADRTVQFDPNKYGWPWIPGTVSWVIPTAFALIALKQISTCCEGRVTQRVRLGTEMLLDRQCPGGGWNAGNGIVLGSPLKPHLDTTAIALIALGDSASNSSTEALSWLRVNWRLCASPYGLAWAAVALDAQRESEFALCVRALEKSLLSRILELNTETLSVSSIALAAAEGEPNPFQTVVK